MTAKVHPVKTVVENYDSCVECSEPVEPMAGAGARLIEKSDALHARDLEALMAAEVLAYQHVVAAQHVGSGLGELGAVPVIGARRQVALLGAHQPLDLVFG